MPYKREYVGSNPTRGTIMNDDNLKTIIENAVFYTKRGTFEGVYEDSFGTKYDLRELEISENLPEGRLEELYNSLYEYGP